MRLRRLLVAALLAVTASVAVAGEAEAAAAERQYRVARRLAAEGSADAVAAMARVAEIDPGGPLADDALVEQALLNNAPTWPEELGRVGPPAARQILALLGGVVEGLPGGDRAGEARYYRGILRLEPVAGYDPALARTDLIAVATSREESRWAARARYALALQNEQGGETGRAKDAYERILVDFPASEAAARARVGLGRLLVREDRCGEAARRIQEAIDAGAAPETRAEPYRELAVACLLDQTGAPAAPGAGTVSRTSLAVRGVRGFAPTPDGGVMLGLARENRVTSFTARGVPAGSWELPGLQALAVDLSGRAHAAAEESIYRLMAAGRVERVASLGEIGPLSAMAADEFGGLWLLDRRGQRVGRLEPGAAAPSVFWEDRAGRLLSVVWDGRRLVAIDGRTKRLVAFRADGSLRPLPVAALSRPVGLGADPSGRLAVLDTRLGQVLLLRRDGTVESVLGYEQEGIERPTALGLGLDGALHLFDAGAGQWVRKP